MPQVIFTADAVGDLLRLREFLLGKSPEAAQRGKAAIVESIQRLALMPEAHRPVADLPHTRELVIKFGATGYLARYRYQRGGDIYILRIRHQREAGFGDDQ